MVRTYEASTERERTEQGHRQHRAMASTLGFLLLLVAQHSPTNPLIKVASALPRIVSAHSPLTHVLWEISHLPDVGLEPFSRSYHDWRFVRSKEADRLGHGKHGFCLA